MNYPGSEFDDVSAALLAPQDYVNPTPQDRYHLAIVGAGSAGLICAIGAAGLGAKVALIERHRMGGDCLNVGCVPSKALLEYSRVHPGDFNGAFEHLRRVRANIAPHDSVERYESLGVEVIKGEARITSPWSVEVGKRTLTTRSIVVAAGGRPFVPPIPGIEDMDYLTSENLWELRQLPERLVVLDALPRAPGGKVAKQALRDDIRRRIAEAQ